MFCMFECGPEGRRNFGPKWDESSREWGKKMREKQIERVVLVQLKENWGSVEKKSSKFVAEFHTQKFQQKPKTVFTFFSNLSGNLLLGWRTHGTNQSPRGYRKIKYAPSSDKLTSWGLWSGEKREFRQISGERRVVMNFDDAVETARWSNEEGNKSKVHVLWMFRKNMFRSGSQLKYYHDPKKMIVYIFFTM